MVVGASGNGVASSTGDNVGRRWWLTASPWRKTSGGAPPRPPRPRLLPLTSSLFRHIMGAAPPDSIGSFFPGKRYKEKVIGMSYNTLPSFYSWSWGQIDPFLLPGSTQSHSHPPPAPLLVLAVELVAGHRFTS